MQLADWVNDLIVRFLLNLPVSEYSSVARLCFQIEEAQWYYEDFIRPLEQAAGNHLPHLPLREFCLLMFKSCPFTSKFTEAQHIGAYEQFLAYKVRVPVRGAILLDESMEKAVLVRGWKKGANWSFPRGKINKDEKDLHCAIREVYEETGYDIRAAGLVSEDEDQAKYIDITMREQHMRLFVFKGVPLDTHFEPKTRKEISKIAWYNLRDLPGWSKKKQADHEHETLQANKFYMVAPFLGPLKRWISQQRRSQTEPVVVENIYADAIPITEEAVASGPENIDTRSQELRQLLNIGTPSMQANTTSEQVRPLQTQQHDLLHLFAGPARSQFSPQPQYIERRQIQQPFPQPVPFHGSGYQYPNGFLPPMQENMAFQHRMQSPHFSMSQPVTHQQGVLTQYPEHQAFQRQSQDNLQRQFTPQQQFSHIQPIHTSYDEPSAMLAAPKASELPAPKLNAHALSLLQAFKAGSGLPASSNMQPLQHSAHQDRLLDLFKSPTQAPATPVSVAPQNKPLSVPESKPREEKKGASIDEFTRTLRSTPSKLSQPSTTTAPPTQEDLIASLERSIDLAPIVSKTHPTRDRKQGGQNKSSLTNGGHIHADSSPRGRKALKTPENNKAQSERRSKAKVQETIKTPTFTILARSDSAKETTPTTFSPQILKRPNESTSVPVEKTEQKDKLLTLFGKASGNKTKPSTQSAHDISTTSSIDPSKPITILRNPSPLTTDVSLPEAPAIQPTKVHMNTNNTNQSSLLGLFKQNDNSPNTPISPFVLGSPTVMRPGQNAHGLRSPIDKRTNVVPERKSSTSATPTEAKGFLLGFLNDVVQKEGRTA